MITTYCKGQPFSKTDAPHGIVWLVAGVTEATMIDLSACADAVWEECE